MFSRGLWSKRLSQKLKDKVHDRHLPSVIVQSSNVSWILRTKESASTITYQPCHMKFKWNNYIGIGLLSFQTSHCELVLYITGLVRLYLVALRDGGLLQFPDGDERRCAGSDDAGQPAGPAALGRQFQRFWKPRIRHVSQRRNGRPRHRTRPAAQLHRGEHYRFIFRPFTSRTVCRLSHSTVSTRLPYCWCAWDWWGSWALITAAFIRTLFFVQFRYWFKDEPARHAPYGVTPLIFISVWFPCMFE